MRKEGQFARKKPAMNYDVYATILPSWHAMQSSEDCAGSMLLAAEQYYVSLENWC